MALRDYTPEQRDVLTRSLRVARRRGASAKVRKALVEALLVESGARNLRHGDRDSVGALQQRPSQGWGPASESLERDVDQFLDRAIPLRRKYGTAGELAQAVQRSAFPGRYDARGGDARSILRGSGPGRVGADRSLRYLADEPSVEPAGPEPSPASVAPLLAQSLERPQVPSAAPPEAAHSARRALALPAAYRAVASSGGPVASPDALDAQIRVAATLGGQMPSEQPTAAPEGVSGGGGGRVPVRSRRGEVVVAPSANRAGAKLQGVLTHFVSEVAGLANHPIEITTGTNHNRLTVNGRVSDHWDGHAADIAVPVDSRRGDVIATAALVAAGVPRGKARQMARAGGLFTLSRGGRRIQVIWRAEGHHDHVHVGIR